MTYQFDKSFFKKWYKNERKRDILNINLQKRQKNFIKVLTIDKKYCNI